jgi:hypothetical protein
MLRIIPFVLLAAVACAPSVPRESTIDLKSVSDGRPLQGVSVENDLILVLVEGRGLVEIDRSGNVVAEHRVGEAGLVDRAYRDVSPTGRDTYILLADNEGYLYDPVTQQQNVHFCVVPEAIVGPITVQKNDAVDVESEIIVAAPRFYEIDESTGEERLTSSEIRTYRLSDGQPTGVAQIQGDAPEIRGLAIDGNAVLAVEGNRALRYSFEAELLGELALDGVEEAAGIAIDALNDEVLVLDAKAEQLAIFSHNEM